MLFALFRKPLWGAGGRSPGARSEAGIGQEASGSADDESLVDEFHAGLDADVPLDLNEDLAAPIDADEHVGALDEVDDVADEVEVSGGAESGTGFQDDPLAASAYDLDRGELIRKAHHGRSGGIPHSTLVESAKEFFGQEILYRFDILDDARRAEVKGSYRIELKGFKGGVWTITVGDELTVVNRREDAEIVLVLQQSDFIQIVNGDLNPQLAILSQKMMVEGDMRKAIAFHAILCPEGE